MKQPAEQPAGLLTEAEHRAIRQAGDLWNTLVEIVNAGGANTADEDCRELVVHVHAIQHAVMAQAAARAYPDTYRPLGGTLRPTRH